jgi:hypothetical protein
LRRRRWRSNTTILVALAHHTAVQSNEPPQICPIRPLSKQTRGASSSGLLMISQMSQSKVLRVPGSIVSPAHIWHQLRMACRSVPRIPLYLRSVSSRSRLQRIQPTDVLDSIHPTDDSSWHWHALQECSLEFSQLDLVVLDPCIYIREHVFCHSNPWICSSEIIIGVSATTNKSSFAWRIR